MKKKRNKKVDFSGCHRQNELPQAFAGYESTLILTISLGQDCPPRKEVEHDLMRLTISKIY